MCFNVFTLWSTLEKTKWFKLKLKAINASGIDRQKKKEEYMQRVRIKIQILHIKNFSDGLIFAYL